MNIIKTLGLDDNSNLKFPVGLYSLKEQLRGGEPFAVLMIGKNGKITLRAGENTRAVSSKVIID